MTDRAWLRKIRADHGWTQADLATRLGVARETVAVWETKGASLDTRTRLAIERLVEKEGQA